MKALVAVLFAAVLLVFSGDVFAQTSTAPYESAFQTAAREISAGVARLNSSALYPSGRTLAYAILGTMMVWFATMAMIRGYGLTQIFADWIPLLMQFAIVLMILNSGVATRISDGIRGLTATFGGPPASQPIGDVVADAAKQGVRVMGNIWDIQRQSADNTCRLTEPIACVGEKLSNVGALVISLLGKAVSILIVAVVFAVFLAHVIFSQIAIYIALSLAPLFVPFIMLPPASFLFDGWLRFLLSSSLVAVVGGFMIGMLNSFVTAAARMAEQMSAANAAAGAGGATPVVLEMLTIGSLVLLIGVAAFLMMQAPSIAQGLISGSGGVGWRGGNPISGALKTGKLAFNTGGAAAKPVLGAGASLAGFGAGASGRVGATSAQNLSKERFTRSFQKGANAGVRASGRSSVNTPQIGGKLPKGGNTPNSGGPSTSGPSTSGPGGTTPSP
jgi:hypothetical protein